jgi:tetratricopeptide (TPR) repeat protein
MTSPWRNACTRWMPVLCALALGGCAAVPSPVLDAALLADAKFAPPSRPVDASSLFKPSPAMLDFLRREVLPLARREGAASALVDALNDRARLKLEYDAEFTRNAAEAFDARAGNCLSLAVMTASLARELGLTVRFQTAVVADMWSRVGDLHVASSHVNLQLSPERPLGAVTTGQDLVVDFLPGAALAGLRVRAIDTDTVMAMYMNNRAAESLMQGALDDAYWWARAAVQLRPDLALAFNTLGVVYQRHGDLARAERVYAQALAIDPAYRQALANQVQLLTRAQRLAEAEPLRQRLARLEPVPPFQDFDDGRLAMQRGDYAAARRHFSRELERSGQQHELHYWLGLAALNLGDLSEARRQLDQARELSTRRGDRERYAGKLQALQQLARQ